LIILIELTLPTSIQDGWGRCYYLTQGKLGTKINKKRQKKPSFSHSLSTHKKYPITIILKPAASTKLNLKQKETPIHQPILNSMVPAAPSHGNHLSLIMTALKQPPHGFLLSSLYRSTPTTTPRTNQTLFFLLAKNKPSSVKASPHNTIFSNKLKLTPTLLFLSSLIGD